MNVSPQQMGRSDATAGAWAGSRAGLHTAAARPTPASTSRSLEQPVLMDCEGDRMLGILHPAAATTGIVIVVGGPQYRGGSHRLFVDMARVAAAAGYPVLRFDVRGMGDSTGDLRGFESISADIGTAIDTLMRHQPHVQRVVLWGLCDGASAALLYLHDRPDVRVAGLCLLNPWVRSPKSHARTQVRHYYLRRIMQPGFWAKLIRGGVSARAGSGLLQAMRVARGGTSVGPLAFTDRMAAAWSQFRGQILLVLSGDDYVAKEFTDRAQREDVWRAAITSPRVCVLELSGADHTVSMRDAKTRLTTACVDWVRERVIDGRAMLHGDEEHGRCKT